MVQWLKLQALSAGSQGPVPGGGTRSHVLQLKTLCASTKTWCSQKKKKKKNNNNFRASLVAQLVKNLPAMQESSCNAGDPGSGRSPGEGNGNPLQYSCLENPIERGAWQVTVHGVARVRHDLGTKPPPQ